MKWSWERLRWFAMVVTLPTWRRLSSCITINFLLVVPLFWYSQLFHCDVNVVTACLHHFLFLVFLPLFGNYHS